MSDKIHLKTSRSEEQVINAAAILFAAQIMKGNVTKETEEKVMDEVIETAIKIAQKVDHRILSDY